jgi:hypothetical protein
MPVRRPLAILLLLSLALAAGFCAVAVPSTARDWEPNARRLPRAEFAGDRVTVRDVRNTVYRTTQDFTPAWDDRSYDLRRLRRVWFAVEPFSTWGGAAHTFLSFEFEGPEFVVISVETRRERGERYGFLKGMLRRYELAYVVADERDAIRLRTNVRRDQVYLYPIRAEPARVRALFVTMLDRANQLAERPEFYHTLFSNCTNNIVRHINALAPGRVPFSLRAVFPGYSDRLAYDLGLIDSDLPYPALRERFGITEAALRHADDPAFSRRIREGLPPTR